VIRREALSLHELACQVSCQCEGWIVRSLIRFLAKEFYDSSLALLKWLPSLKEEPMIARVLDLSGLVIVVTIAVIGFLIPVILGAVRKESGLLPGIEAAILAVLGGLLARGFIGILLASANDSAGAGLAVGWGFFLVPGMVDTLVGHPVLTTPDILLLFGTIVGGFTGMMAGIYQIYDWVGLGLLAFPLDVTWALAGATVGCLLHVINIGWGDHGDETRENAHRYASGFGLRYNPPYAFTQGAVMSNLAEAPLGNLYRHEKTHVWQSRIFGPMYTLTYVAWIVIWIIPAVIAGIIVKGPAGLFYGPNNWCYFNNPWETWAYAVQGAARTDINGVDENDRKMIWPARFVIAWSVPFFALAIVLAVLTVAAVWGGSAPPRNKSNIPARRPHARFYPWDLSPDGHPPEIVSLHLERTGGESGSVGNAIVTHCGSSVDKTLGNSVNARLPGRGLSKFLDSAVGA
jgi:hypothetical protein